MYAACIAGWAGLRVQVSDSDMRSRSPRGTAETGGPGGVKGQGIHLPDMPSEAPKARPAPTHPPCCGCGRKKLSILTCVPPEDECGAARARLAGTPQIGPRGWLTSSNCDNTAERTLHSCSIRKAKMRS